MAHLIALLGRGRLLNQMFRFGVTTGVSAIVTIGVPVLLHEGFGVSPPLATAIAFAAAFLMNFLTLRRVVFRSSAGLRRDFVAFAGSSLAFRVIEYLMFLLLNVGLHVFYLVTLLIVLATSTVAKFFWYRWIIGGFGRLADG